QPRHLECSALAGRTGALRCERHFILPMQTRKRLIYIAKWSVAQDRRPQDRRRQWDRRAGKCSECGAPTNPLDRPAYGSLCELCTAVAARTAPRLKYRPELDPHTS